MDGCLYTESHTASPATIPAPGQHIALNVIVRSGCMVSVDLYPDSLHSPLYTNTTCAIRTAKWMLMLTV